MKFKLFTFLSLTFIIHLLLSCGNENKNDIKHKKVEVEVSLQDVKMANEHQLDSLRTICYNNVKKLNFLYWNDRGERSQSYVEMTRKYYNLISLIDHRRTEYILYNLEKYGY